MYYQRTNSVDYIDISDVVKVFPHLSLNPNYRIFHFCCHSYHSNYATGAVKINAVPDVKITLPLINTFEVSNGIPLGDALFRDASPEGAFEAILFQHLADRMDPIRYRPYMTKHPLHYNRDWLIDLDVEDWRPKAFIDKNGIVSHVQVFILNDLRYRLIDDIATVELHRYTFSRNIQLYRSLRSRERIFKNTDDDFSRYDNQHLCCTISTLTESIATTLSEHDDRLLPSLSVSFNEARCVFDQAEIWINGYERYWYKCAWSALEEKGDTVYASRYEYYKVLFYALTITKVYDDFCKAAFEIGQSFDLPNMALEAIPEEELWQFIGQYTGCIYKDRELDYVLNIIVDELKNEVFDTIGSVMSRDSVFTWMYCTGTTQFYPEIDNNKNDNDEMQRYVIETYEDYEAMICHCQEEVLNYEITGNKLEAYNDLSTLI